MSGLSGMAVTHDTTERLSWYLFAPVSTPRPGYAAGQQQMKQMCSNCHARSGIDRFFTAAEATVASSTTTVAQVQTLMKSLRAVGVVSAAPFVETIEFLEFDYWHYFGRTAKHGAFMGGADYVLWHGNYELLKVAKEIEEKATEMRAHHAATPAVDAKAP
jgi:hypothetical protein